MKEKITSLVLVLVVAMSMTVGASAASYIPDDVTYGSIGGRSKFVIVLFPEPFGPAKTTISGFLIDLFSIATFSYCLAHKGLSAISVFHIDFAAFGVKSSNGLIQKALFFQLIFYS